MGKRQFRIFQKDILSNRDQLLRLDVHVILWTNIVLQGIVTELMDGQLTLQNHRLHQQTIDLTEIEEIVYDKEAAY